MAGENLVNIGLGNYILTSRVVAILNPTSSPMRRLREDAKAESRLVDATQGRKTRSIIVLDSNHIVLSSVLPDTMGQRFIAAIHNIGDSAHYLNEDISAGEDDKSQSEWNEQNDVLDNEFDE